jgi:serine/threonine protein kinase
MIGNTVSHYRILASLGSGGMSVVYKAQDMRLGRFVALKFLLEKFCSSAEALDLFRQEARTACSLNHPGLCTIYDIGKHLDRPYIVMEFLDGETLRDKLRWRGLTMKQAVACAIEIADALGQAHAGGVVHRDITPRNLFITRDGRVKLLDFGIAKLMSATYGVDESRHQSPSQRYSLTGTVYYMSPEQALCLDVDARSDIFSFGVVLFEMLTGRHPFSGPDIMSTIDQIVRGTQEPLGRIVPDIPASIQAVVLRCLEKRREQRYETAIKLRDALQAAAAASTLDEQHLVRARTASEADLSESQASLADTIPDTTHMTQFAVGRST